MNLEGHLPTSHLSASTAIHSAISIRLSAPKVHFSINLCKSSHFKKAWFCLVEVLFGSFQSKIKPENWGNVKPWILLLTNWYVPWASQLKFSPERSDDNIIFSQWTRPSQQDHLHELNHFACLLLESTFSLAHPPSHFSVFFILKITSDIIYTIYHLLFLPSFPGPRLDHRSMPWAWEQTLVIANKWEPIPTAY